MADGSKHGGPSARGRSLSLALTLVIAVCILLVGSSPAGGTPRGVSAAAAAMSVHFTFHATAEYSDHTFYSFVGSGTMKLSDTPAARVTARAAYGTSTIVIHHLGSSATFKVFSTGYSYEYLFNKDETLSQAVKLHGDISRSTIRACHVGSSGSLEFGIVDGVRHVQGNVCGKTLSVHGAVNIVPTPKPALLPSKLTLTVNGVSCTARVGKNCYRTGYPDPPVVAAANTSLSMEAETDHPMPKGWTLEIRRTGDPLSSSGNYYQVCSTTTDDTCEGTRPGQPAGYPDGVYADVHGPTGGPILYAEIHVTWK
jgi:hypothetical protein